MNFLRKSGSLVAVWIKSLATAAQYSFCSGSRSHGTNIVMTHFMQRSLVKILDTVVFKSPDQLLVLTLSVTIFVDCSPYTFNILRCSAWCRPSRTWITFNRFSTIFEAFVLHFYLCCTHCIIPKSLLNHPNSFREVMFKLNAKFDANSLLYLLSHFECHGHTVHMLTQWGLLPPLTSTVKSLLFMHMHSSPWLPGYINVTWTILHVLTILDFFWTDLKQWICIKFCVKLQHSFAEILDNWEGHCYRQLIIGSFIAITHLLMYPILYRDFWQNIKSPRLLSLSAD